MRKFVALYDIHIGYERGLTGGAYVARPTHNAPAIKAVLKFVNDFAPDVVILGGDQLNCGPVSHWHKGKPILEEGFRLKDQMELLYSMVLEPIAPASTKVWLDGNHEAWIYDFVEENPGVQGLIEPVEYLQLKDIGYEIKSQGEIYTLGKLHFAHGDTVLGRGSGTNPAKSLVNAYRRNIRAGHVHTYSAAIEKTAVDARDFHSGVVVPSLSTRNPFWVKGNPNCFINGFLYGYVHKDGSFSDEVVIVNDNRFTVNGRFYKP